MSYPWHEFHAALMRSSSTLEFQRQFETVRERDGILSCFRDRAHLLDYLHHSADPAEGKNVILSVVVEAAQGSAPAADCALTLMLLALWPGLDAVNRRGRARRLVPPDELASEILSRAVIAIRTLDLARVNWIAATILKNIERDIRRGRRRENGRERQQFALDEIPASIIVTTASTPSREHLHDEIVRQIGGDGSIVVCVAVDGFSQAEAAAEFGLSAAAARKRYQRATGRLQTILQDWR